MAPEECKSETAENSIEEHVEGGHDADGEEMTDGIEEDFDEDGSNDLVQLIGNDSILPVICVYFTMVQKEQKLIKMQSHMQYGNP